MAKNKSTPEEIHRRRVEGGKKAAETMKRKYGPDYFHKLGIEGGAAGDKDKRGYASKKVGKDGLLGKERARRDGRKGGRRSKRTPYSPEERRRRNLI